MEENKPQTPIRKLTKKQEIFATAVAKTGDPTAAALLAFDTTNKATAASIANEYLKKPQVIQAVEEKRKTLKQALIDRGIDEDKIAEKVEVLLDATDKDGNTDYNAVDKGLKHATVIHGVLDTSDAPRTQNTYNIIFSAPVQEKVRVIEAELKNILTKPQHA